MTIDRFLLETFSLVSFLFIPLLFFCASTPFFINNSTLLSAIIAPRYLACESGRLEGRVVVTPRRRPIMLLRTNMTSFLFFFSFRRPRLPAARRESVLGSVTIFLQIG